MDDLVAVLDAVECQQAVVFGTSEGGPLAIMFAASHPERTTVLALLNSFARLSRGDDYPIGIPPDVYRRFVDTAIADYGTGRSVGSLVSPDLEADLFSLEWRGRLERQSASPATARAIHEAVFALDVRDVLPAVTTPTLVLHRSEDRYIRADHGRYLSEHIAGARYVELPGTITPSLPHRMRSTSCKSSSPVRGPERTSNEYSPRCCSPISSLSTARAAEMGDARWLERLDRHNHVVARQLQRFSGRCVKNTGDGILAMSMDRAVRYGAPSPSGTACGASGSRAEPVSTPAR